MGVVKTQFNSQLKSFQCDNGGEYNNSDFHRYFDTHGIQVRFSCPHTSQQNGKSERMIRTINNTIRALLFQAHLSPSYWVEALHVAVHILNILPSSAIHNKIPFSILFNKPPKYDHLKVFGCLCFPNLNHSNLHKLSPRSTPCLFLGYPSQHSGYRCLDLKTNKIIISRHVLFDETVFPAAQKQSQAATYQFLEILDDPSPLFKAILQSSIPTPPLPSTATTPTPPLSQSNPPATTIIAAPSAPTGHSMTTRSKAGIHKPKSVLSLLTSVSPLPNSHIKALSDPNWNPAMTDEYDAIIKTRTWDLVPRPKDANIVRSMWLFKHKYDAGGSLTRHKARLVANANPKRLELTSTKHSVPSSNPPLSEQCLM